jgi:hypothetical protein
MELRPDGVEEVILFEQLAAGNGFDRAQRFLRPVDVGDGDGAMERDDGRMVQLHEHVVKGENARPIGRLVGGGDAVTGSDSRFEMEFADLISGG